MSPPEVPLCLADILNYSAFSIPTRICLLMKIRITICGVSGQPESIDRHAREHRDITTGFAYHDYSTQMMHPAPCVSPPQIAQAAYPPPFSRRL